MAAAKKKSRARESLDAMFADHTADLPDPSYRGKEKRLGIVRDLKPKQDTPSEQNDQSKVNSLPLVADRLLLVDEPVADRVSLVDEPVADGLLPVIDGSSLVADGLSPVGSHYPGAKTTRRPEQDWIPLSPLQWQVWEVLLSADTKQSVVSYKETALIAKASIQGVRKAFGVLEKEGGILKRQVVRERTVQGLRVTIDRTRPFRQVTLRDTQALIRREDVTSDRPSATATSSRPPRMYVCKKNTYIQEEDLAALLQLSPKDWRIREQTLVQIADAFPVMTALQFRLSLRRLIEQANTSKSTIQNPNAWLKAAFEKNGNPLVTELEIETRFAQNGPARSQPQPSVPQELEENRDLEILRRYMAANPKERAQIDEMAQKSAAPLLATFSADRHDGILEQAKIESTREFFGL